MTLAPSLEAAIAALLKDDNGVVALVAKRVYPQALPNGVELPAITYQRISTGHQRAMTHDLPNVLGRVQLTTWGKSYGDAKDAQVAVRKATQNYKGTVGTTVIDDIGIDDERDRPREADTGLYPCLTDLLVWYRES